MAEGNDDKILFDMDSGSRERTKKYSSKEIPTENDPDEVTGSDSESNSESDSDSSESDSSDSSNSYSEYVCTVCDKTFSGYIPLKQHEKGSKHKKAVTRKKKLGKLLNRDADDDENAEGQEYLIQEPFAVCKTCAKQFSGPESHHMHLKSKAHKQKVLEASVLEQVKEDGVINVDKLRKLYRQKKSALEKAPVRVDNDEDCDELGAGEYECKTCEKSFTGLTPYAQHLVSKTHAKQEERKKLLHKIVPEPSTSSEISEINDENVLVVDDNILLCKACSTSFSGPENAILHMKSQKHKKQLEKYKRKLEKKKNKVRQLKELKESNSDSKRKEDDLQKENEREGKTSEGEDEPDTNLSDESSGSARLAKEETEEELTVSGANVDENLTHEKFVSYKKAMESLRQEHGD